MPDSLTPKQARAALEAAGVADLPALIELERHGDRWLAFLAGGRLAVFTTTDGRARVIRERAVLRALERRCSFAAPRILAEAPDGNCDVREMVPGPHATDAAYARVHDDDASARKVGMALGRMIAELHTEVRAADLTMTLPSIPEWPEPRTWIRDRLPRVIDDSALNAAADRIIARFEDAGPAGRASDRVLVHTDLGLHNVAIDPVTLEVHGIFDWEGACWSDRHLDFRHLVFDLQSHPLFWHSARASIPASHGAAARSPKTCTGHALP